MSVNLHIAITVRKYQSAGAEAVKQAIQRIIEDEELNEDLPPLIEKPDGKAIMLFTQSDRNVPVIISGSYAWIPTVQGALSQAADLANGGPCEVLFDAVDADGLDDDWLDDGEDPDASERRGLEIALGRKLTEDEVAQIQHHCAVCGRHISKETNLGGAPVKFKILAEWICDDHLEAARERSKLAAGAAISEIQKILGIRPAEWSTNKRLFLTHVGPNRAKVFAIVRQLTGASPPVARDLLNHLPAMLKEDWPEIVEKWRRNLIDIGATVEIVCPTYPT